MKMNAVLFISPERKLGGEEKHLHHHVHLLIQEYGDVLLLRRVSFIICSTLHLLLFLLFLSCSKCGKERVKKKRAKEGGTIILPMSDFFGGDGRGAL